METIILAGGCFWGVEAYFKLVEGVKDTTVGYIDGKKANPTYEEVCRGSMHTEAVEVIYDETVISLEKLLAHYFNIVNPTFKNRQGPDIGVQYRSGFYNFTDAQKNVLEDAIKKEQSRLGKPVYIDLKTQCVFYPAELYHQDYLDKVQHGYCHINLSSVKNIK